MDRDPLRPDPSVSPNVEPVSSDIPILLDGTVRWVTGLTKRTTCDDVIYALLYNDGNHGGETTENYAIYERWRDVEKPLQARTKIVKIWRAWGADQCNVELCVRKIPDDNYASCDSCRPRRRHKRSTKHRTKHYRECGCRPGTHRNCYNARKIGSLESLVKLVIAQERTLHLLAQRIWRTDGKIETLETNRHFCRVKENGDDYVQSVYLDSLSEDSMDELFGNVRTEDIEEYLAFCERIIQLEEILTGKQGKMKEIQKLLQGSLAKCNNVRDLDPDLPCGDEFEQVQVDIRRVVSAEVMQRYEEATVKRELQQCDRHLETKRQLIRSLKHDLDSMQEHKGQDRDLHANLHQEKVPLREVVPSGSSEDSRNLDNRLRASGGPGRANGQIHNNVNSAYHSQGFSNTAKVFTDHPMSSVSAGHPEHKMQHRASVFSNGKDCLPDRNIMENPCSDSTEDEADRVSVIQIYDSPPKTRSKCVTFNDRLNHMHVIGTSRESLSERTADPEGPGVSRNTYVQANTTSCKRQPDYPAPQHKVISILKNNSNKNHVADKTGTTLTNTAPFGQQGELILDKLASSHDSGRYHLPSGMYTFAKDGHYFLPESTHRPYKEEDSNSDTGLSSMHSDESPGLETLV